MAQYYGTGHIVAPVRTSSRSKSLEPVPKVTSINRSLSLPSIVNVLNLEAGGVGTSSNLKLVINKRSRAKGNKSFA